MSHQQQQQQQQAFGATSGYTTLPQQQSQHPQQQPGINASSAAFVRNQQIMEQQHQFLAPQINLAQQQYEAWQQYYSNQFTTPQIPQQMPFISGQSTHQSPLSSYQAVFAQQQQQLMNSPVGMANQSINAMLPPQSQQILFPQQHLTTSDYTSAASCQSVSDIASLAAQQQYLLFTQQQQQQQQYLQQQQKQHLPQQFIPKQPQQSPQHQIHSMPKTPIIEPTSQVPISVPSSSSLESSINCAATSQFLHSQQSLPQLPIENTQQKSQFSKSGSTTNVQHKINIQQQQSPLPLIQQVQQQQQQRIKTPEDARLLAQKELEAQAKRKADEETKQSHLVQEELKRKQLSDHEHAQSVQEKLQSIPEPIHLAGCHTLSKVGAFLPFPSEMLSTSTLLPCFDQQQLQLVLANTDTQLADYLGTLLSDTTDQLRKIELKHGEDEPSDLANISPVPSLIQAVHEMSQFAFSVEPEPFEEEDEAAAAAAETIGGHLMTAEMNELAEAVLKCSGALDLDQQQQENEFEHRKDDKLHENETHRQTISAGKPKDGGGTAAKRKKDMVESLYDSLTAYYDSKGQKRRNRRPHSGTDDDDDGQSSTSTNDQASEGPASSTAEIGSDGETRTVKKERSRKRRRNSDEDLSAAKKTNRPPTPTEVIKQRELEWNERQRQREEKYKKRRQMVQCEQPIHDIWSSDVIAVNDSVCRFVALVDQVFEQIDDAMCSMPSSTSLNIGEESSTLLLERALIDELRIEAQKLKAWQKLPEVSTERLIKLLTIMEKNIRDVLSDDGDLSVLVKAKDADEDEFEETLRELIDERLLRSVDAALVSMCIMTCKRVPKQVLMEDIIERSIQLCKQCLQSVIYPSVDSTLKTQANKPSRKSMADQNTSMFSKRRRNFHTTQLYGRLVELMGCFSELVHFHNLNETLIIQLSSLGTPPFFVENVPEVQMQAIKLLPTIFAKCPSLRKTILMELLNTLHRLPLARTIRNTYRLSATESIGNFTVLILQLMQSTVQLPSRKSHHGGHYHDSKKGIVDEHFDDRHVLESYEKTKKLAAFFLGGFLAKCTARAEDDYRRMFEQLLQDILVALYRPMWPVAELILTVLGNLLVVHFRTKTYDLSLRVASLDYLGIIAARLRKDRVHALVCDATAQEKTRLNSIIKSILFDENSYDPSYNIENIDISHLSSNDKIRKLEQALFDYIIGTMWNGDVSVEYVLLFYAVEWYRETVLDVEVVKERYTKAIAKGDLPHKEKQKYEQKMLRIAEKGHSMKFFIIGLMDKQHLKRRMQIIAKNDNVTMVDSDALWVVKYLAGKKELSSSFDVYLRKILEAFNPDIYPVAIRAKAMKCLAQIVEADYQVLMIPEVNKIVQDRLIDANASVREATFDLIGKCLVSKPDLLDTYYSILINRMKDTAVAVRKRVIRILRDIVISRHQQQQEYEKNPQMLSEIIQRVNDEEGVKKLCLDTFQQIWMLPTQDKIKLDAKVKLLVETAKFSITEGSIEYFETIISVLIKKTQEQTTMAAAKQLVDALVDYVLLLEKKVIQEQKEVAMSETKVVDTTKNFQARQFAALTTLSFFAKARSELLIQHIEVFIPYLTVAEASTLESRVLNQIITMLEQIIPLMDSYGTSQTLVRQLDTRLNKIAEDGGMLLIASAIACMSAVHNKFQQDEQPGICRLFVVYFEYLDICKREMEQNELNPDKKPKLLRSLYSIGLMCRYFDFDLLLTQNQRRIFEISNKYANTNGTCTNASDDTGFKENQCNQTTGVVRTAVFNVLFYFSRAPDHSITQKALISLGQLAAGCPELLRRGELKNMYTVLLKSDKRAYLQLKVQVLKNIASFLFAEEQKALKRAEKTKAEREQLQRLQEDESLQLDPPEQPTAMADDLKEMELGSSGLSSSIIQQYWDDILKCYFSNDEMVRISSSQVIRQTLEQGLVTPGFSVPTLVAMLTDPLSSIRTRVEPLIRDMNTKYKGLILSNTVAGVRLAFQLQKKIRADTKKIIRGIRSIENPLGNSNKTTCSSDKGLPIYSADAQPLLGSFYLNIRTNRQNRRSFLASLLKLFSEEHKEKNVDREEWLFLADNLAHFPYTVMDEPLYVIHQSNAIISVSGQNIISHFRQLLTPPTAAEQLQQLSHQQGTHSHSSTPPRRRTTTEHSSCTSTSTSLLNSSTDELEEFSVQYIMEHLPDDRTQINELKRNSQACFILLHLKTFLMHMYGLKEDKIVEYSPSEAAQVYERPVNRRNITVFSPDFILNELSVSLKSDDGTIPKQTTQAENQNIAEDFHKFHEMLLSLDERRDEEEEITPIISADDTTISVFE